MTVPNVGVEFDLSGRATNRRSISLFGQYNGNTHHTINPSLVFNIASARVEYRKYWRTGRYGQAIYYHDRYVPLHIDKKDMSTYNADSTRSMLYNRYHKVRRRLSARLVDNPRIWRAYYIGAWAGGDWYSICLGGSGRQGKAVGLGATAGWTVPLLPSSYPGEGGLDLDLGANIGIMAANSTLYHYEEESGCYAFTRSTGFHVLKYPVLQDVHVSLVYRFRSISRKTTLATVDDYEHVIARFNERKDEHQREIDSLRVRNEFLADSTATAQRIEADSTAFWDVFQKRRLENALIINPDTVFTGNDLYLYSKIVKGIDPKKINTEKLEKQQKKEAKRAEQEALKAEREAEKAAEKARREAEKAAQKARKAGTDPAKEGEVPTAEPETNPVES